MLAQASAAGTGERKEYAGTLPLCNKCKFHHSGPCTIKCSNCKRVGAFKVLEQVESVAYKLKLPQERSRVHNTFHISNLRKCYTDEPLAVPLGGLHLDNELCFDGTASGALEFRTWEREDQLWKKYPHLFTKTAPSSSAVS
ncbi:hypothetical protein Tco_1102736 [Tanacetum coccineum]